MYWRKSEYIDTDWLYSLHENGTVEKEFLISPKSHYSGYDQDYDWDTGEDEVVIEAKQYIKTILGSEQMTVNLVGKMEVIQYEEEDGLEFTESLIMPVDIENDLRAFLDVAIKQDVS